VNFDIYTSNPSIICIFFYFNKFLCDECYYHRFLRIFFVILREDISQNVVK